MDVKIFTDLIEEKAEAQVYEMANLPAFKDAKIRIMPDVHAGMGCVIGFTANLGSKVVPNIVGVDIGCSIRTIMLGQINLDLGKLDIQLRKLIPTGFNVHNKQRDFPLETLRCFNELKNPSRIRKSIGTLGGGNHFIEVDVDEFGRKYLIIHTGSRNLGHQVAELYQKKAIEYIAGTDDLNKKKKELIEYLTGLGRVSEIEESLKDLTEQYKTMKPGIPEALCYLEGEQADDYLHDMRICQKFAERNREVIGNIICEAMDILPIYNFETVHNYISSDNIVRKGAISAQKGEPVLIPLNMKDGCILGVGLGNEDWNCSAPHGAGRMMSRIQAKKTLEYGRI